MKNLFLSLSILLVGSFAVANQNSNNTKVNEYEYYTINEDMSVTYCVSAGGQLFCCEAATYPEAQSCARSMAIQAFEPQG
ncbi:hypothetical protein QP547_04065 [Weeksella virosa]|uniref:hypothetical protein n=1 Tax=Flavobacteriales TaxID=200644 RepID=UPI000838598A|nr:MULTISPECIES: hypothetical protein [Flavobacteriales]MDK7674984.1 hypothetical protein [Weeksella virosa]SUP53318.1 Uncharacterised protein [Weeksella virosa]